MKSKLIKHSMGYLSELISLHTRVRLSGMWLVCLKVLFTDFKFATYRQSGVATGCRALK